MMSAKAPQPISTQGKPSPAVEGELTAEHGSAHLPLWIAGSTAAPNPGALPRKAPSSTIAYRWISKPRVLLDRELCIVRANRSLCRSFGVLQGSLIGTRLDDWINVYPGVLACLRSRLGSGLAPWHMILRLHLSGSRVLAASQILQPLHSYHCGYLLISLAGIQFD